MLASAQLPDTLLRGVRWAVQAPAEPATSALSCPPKPCLSVSIYPSSQHAALGFGDIHVSHVSSTPPVHRAVLNVLGGLEEAGAVLPPCLAPACHNLACGRLWSGASARKWYYLKGLQLCTTRNGHVLCGLRAAVFPMDRFAAAQRTGEGAAGPRVVCC